MRTLPAGMAAKIDTQVFAGTSKATTRVLIQKWTLREYTYSMNRYASALFQFVKDTQAQDMLVPWAEELPNVRSVSIERSTDDQVGRLTMELWNTTRLPPGALPVQELDPFDAPGFYTYNRGNTPLSPQWGHDPKTIWTGMLVPDRLIRVYQGYGVDYDKPPEKDPNLILTGIFLIDDVTYSADGLITVEARDLGRILIDQIMFPPVIPFGSYPMSWSQYKLIDRPKIPQASTAWVKPTLNTASGTPPTGGITTQFGHHPSHAVDASSHNQGTYWLSEGFNVPNHPSSYVWWEGKLNGVLPSAVKLGVRGGPYRVYVSLYTDKARGGSKTGWRGSKNIPYVKASTLPDNKSKIPYAMTFISPHNSTKEVKVPVRLKGVTKIRFTFTNLYNSRHQPKPYRAAVRDIQVLVGTTIMVAPTPPQELVGNYGDYSDIVKKLLAYGGFFWPRFATQKFTRDSEKEYFWDVGDEWLGKWQKSPAASPGYPYFGRIWGDIKMSGTQGKVDLGMEIWDKKPIMDGINYVKDILGFIFFVDATGGAVFRPPNVFSLGNWRSDPDGFATTRVEEFITLRDTQAIIGLRSKLSSRNLRERVFVANTNGKVGAIVHGRLPYPVNLRRVAGWTDQNFEKVDECVVMADMITLRQMFTYRTNSIRIVANPAIEIDDQIKIEERVTGDAFYHYVRGVSSKWTAEDGKWVMDLTTSWLGSDPHGEWAFKTANFRDETRRYLLALGAIA